MVSHCIFVREYVGSQARHPVMLAYDIPDRAEAEALVQSVAQSYLANGIDPNSQMRWFYYSDRRHEIYTWPRRGLPAVKLGLYANHIEERYASGRDDIPAPVPR